MPGIRSSPVIALPTIVVLEASWIEFCSDRSNIPLFRLSFSLFLFSFLSRVFFLLYFSHLHPPSLVPRSCSPSFAFLRVVRAYEFDFTQFPSIERSAVNYFSSSRSRSAFESLLLFCPLLPLVSPISPFLLRLFRPTP